MSEDWRDKIERHSGESIFHGSREEWINNYNPYEWDKTTGRKQINKEQYEMYWSSRSGSMWVRVK